MDETTSLSGRKRRFSEEFKEDAVGLVVREKYTFRAAAVAVAPLVFEEYLLIGVASELLPNDLLNREGRIQLARQQSSGMTDR